MVPQILRLSPTGPQSRGLRSAADRFWTVLRLLGQILDKLRSSQEELGGWDEDSDMRTKWGFKWKFWAHSTRKERWMVSRTTRLGSTGSQSRGLRSAASGFLTKNWRFCRGADIQAGALSWIMRTVTPGPNKLSNGLLLFHSTRQERWSVPGSSVLALRFHEVGGSDWALTKNELKTMHKRGSARRPARSYTNSWLIQCIKGVVWGA